MADQNNGIDLGNGLRPATFRIKLITPCRRTRIEVGRFHFDTELGVDDADAVLCEWSPDATLLETEKPTAWYCCEPTSSNLFAKESWQLFRKQLAPHQFLYHAHPNSAFRVPHITFDDDPLHPDYLGLDNLLKRLHSIGGVPSGDRKRKAVAVVSNSGSGIATKAMELRRTFVVAPQVELFGSRLSWRGFRRIAGILPAPPRNYRGEIPGFWTGAAKLRRLTEYKVNVCLENTWEDWYFTEKFVGAVLAGCIPIYHACESVRERFLQGAAWVDPADFNFQADETLAFALNEDIEKYWDANLRWLQSEAFLETTARAVFERIGGILCGAAAGEGSPYPEPPATIDHPGAA